MFSTCFSNLHIHNHCSLKKIKKMRRLTQSFLILFFLVLSVASVSAQQGQYKLDYNAGTQTYTVYGKVNTF